VFLKYVLLFLFLNELIKDIIKDSKYLSNLIEYKKIVSKNEVWYYLDFDFNCLSKNIFVIKKSWISNSIRKIIYKVFFMDWSEFDWLLFSNYLFIIFSII
jgi:hypothetical protein